MAFWHHGSGRALVMLHGNSGSKKTFSKYLLEYFTDFHGFALDSRGHGQSQSRDTQLTYEQQSLDVIEFCKTKGLQDVSVIGYSDGGILGLWLAVKAPEIFSKIVSISPNTVASASTEGFMQFLTKTLRTLNFFKKLGFPVKKQIMRFQLMQTDSGIRDEDLKRINTKVMIIYAEKDMVAEDHITHIAKLIPDCKLEKVMDCTHMTIPHQEETLRIIRAFLNA
jgi:pimeloyl-ACP methyl ester carboxylesterase